MDVTLPTLALVGAPNVGKSSLVKLLSTGQPEVCNYPFTTRSIKMGHFFIDGKKHQVTGTWIGGVGGEWAWNRVCLHSPRSPQGHREEGWTGW